VAREDYPLRKVNRAIDLSSILQKDPHEVYSKVDAGDNSDVAQAKEAVTPSQRETLLSLGQQQVTPQESIKILSEQAEKIAIASGQEDLVLEGILTYGDPNFSPNYTKLLVFQAMAAERGEQKLRDNWEDASTTGLVLDFLDRYILRQLPIGAVEDLTFRSERRGGAIAQEAMDTPMSEWPAMIDRYWEEAEAEGVFRSDNYFALQAQYDELINSGYDPQAALDAALAILDIPAKPLALLATGRFLTKIGVFKGPKVAADVAEDMQKNASKGIDPEIVVETNPKPMDPSAGPGQVKPTVSRVTKVLEDNDTFAYVDHLTKSGAFGRRASQEQIQELADEIKKNVEAAHDLPVADYELERLPLDEYNAVFRVGKNQDGSPFETAEMAQLRSNFLTERGLATRVEPVSPDNPDLGYYVAIRERIDQSDIVDDISLADLNNVFTRGISKVLSTRVFDDPRLNVLALQGTSAIAALNKTVQKQIRALEKMPVRKQEALSAIYRELRDGKKAYVREGLTRNEFDTMWEDTYGKPSVDQDWEAYLSVKTLNDTAYFIRANELTRRFVNAGYKALDPADGDTIVATRVSNVPESATVKNLSDGKTYDSSMIPEEMAVWKSEDGKFYMSPKKVRNLEYRDVYGYNAGGQRLNPDARYFVTLTDGENKRGVRAILTAFSSKDAGIAKAELKAIRAAFLETGKEFGELTDELDDVLKANARWAGGTIARTQDFVEWANKNGVDFKYDIDLKARDGILEDASDLWDGLDYDMFFRAKLKRSDEVLMSFGGDKTWNNSPVKDITAQLSSAFGSYAMRNYTESALHSWNAKAYRKDKLSKGVNPRAAFDKKLNELSNKKGLLPEERRLLDIGNIIQRRLDAKDPATKAMERYGDAVREFVFDKTGKAIPETSIQSGLLQLGFQSAFGFYNLSQFIIQASQVGAISIISPRYGLKAAAITPALRLALHNGTDEAVKRAASVLGVPEKDAKELFEYLWTSGRADVENDALEKMTGPGMSISGYEGKSYLPSVVREGLYRTSQMGKALLKAGTTPFAEGERLTRLTGLTTAVLEFKAKHPDMSILSDFGRQWITNREQALTFDMTTASKSAIQQGIWRLPAQWTSYAFRAMEAVVVGSRKTGKNEVLTGLTKWERVRLGMFLVGQGGLAGMGAGWALDEIASWLGLEAEDTGIAAIKYGFYDAIFSYFFQGITGADDLRTAMGSRLAPWTVFSDIYRKVTEEETWTAIGGPSSEIAGTAIGSTVRAVGNVYDGAYLSAWEDIKKVLRTPAGVNNMMVARGILQHGTYTTKTGKVLPIEMDDADALLASLGVSNFKIVDYYNTANKVWRDSRDVDKVSKELTNDFRTATRYYRDGDVDYGLQLIKEISARIDVSGFSEADKAILRRRLRENTRNEMNELMFYLYQREQKFAAEVLESLRGN
jgi:hypothetical protein